MKVYKTACQNCLLSRDAIVSPDRRQELIKSCLKSQKYFVCHKASFKGEDVCCKKFYDRYKNRIQSLQLGTRLGLIEEVDQPDNKKLISYLKQKGIR